MKSVPVSPVTVNVTDTLPSGAPSALRARTATRSSNAWPAVARSGPVPAFSSEPKVSAGVGLEVGGFGFGLVEPSPGFEGPGVGFPPGLSGEGFGLGVVLGPGLVLGPGFGEGVLGVVGSVPVPSGISCVPRW